ncbi:hypothetical protein LJB91_01220 [Bacteroidales bacterium OttesenSCG-928-L03]|nr:hypothetical protein [Bacteroidales bacterium OttesenSCG-928-L03]
MNKLFKNTMLALAVAVLGLSFNSCDDDDNKGGEHEVLFQQILSSYVDGTVIPTYKAMAEAALDMQTANNALKEGVTDAKIEAAASAWMAARIWWEKSEAFLFGPVAEDGFNIDAHIDSWPLELEDIKKEIEEKNGNITSEQAWNEEEGVIGFHTTEYLLFRDGKPRKADELTAAEVKYLTAVTDALVWDCVLAYVAWAGESNVSSAILAVFNSNEDVLDFYNEPTRKSKQDFGEKMKAGEPQYPSLEAAVSEISEGAKTIAEEVGATKIAAPYDDRLIEEVESWYSWHSLDDYTNNIESIKNAYLGGLGNSSRTPKACLSTYVAKVDANLDQAIRAKIDDCIEKIQNIGKDGKSFYEVVRDQTNEAEVEAAVAACLELRDLFGKITEKLQ